MESEKKVLAVNLIINRYFSKHPREIKIPAKDLMPEFVKYGVFAQNHRNGLPIRDLLRRLDKENNLEAIPFAYAERKAKNTNWFFVRFSKFSGPERMEIPSTTTKTTINPSTTSRKDSDENYVLDLCDEVLGKKSSRQHKFEFLLGDSGTKLPVDAFYEDLNLAIEYRERQHSEDVPHFDKPHKMTVSGVHRREQRRLYDQRRRNVLPENDITLIEIDYTQFTFDRRKKIVRNKVEDLKVINKILNDINNKLTNRE